MILKGKINLGCLKAEEEIEVISTGEEQVITPANPNNTFNKVIVKPIEEKKIEENKTVKSTDEQQIIKPSEGYDAIGKITVKPVPLGTTQIRPSAKMDILEKPPAGVDGFVSVLVERVDNTIDENITEENIREGVSILGITGKLHESIIEEEKIVKSTEEEQTIAPSEGYDGIKSIKVLPISLEEKTIKPSINEEVITPSEDADGIKKITVAPVDASIDENIIPENIAEGITVLGVEGTHKGGGEDTLSQRILNQLTEYTIPAEAKKLQPYLFYMDDRSAQPYKINLNNNVESYPQNFMYQNNIEDLFIPKNKNDKKIAFGNYAFNKNYFLSIELEEGIQCSFGAYVFKDCNSAITAIIPHADGISLFEGCYALETVTFKTNSYSSATIGNKAFYNCKKLKNIELPENITTIGTNAFYGCIALNQFKITNPNCTMTNNSFGNCTGITDFRVAAGHKQALYLSDMPLTHDSLVALINNLGTVSSLALTIGSTNKAKLSEAEIAVATNKGWVVS